jgi:hypothetical protein
VFRFKWEIIRIIIISKLVVCLTQKVNGIVDGIDFTEELSRKIIIIIMFWVGLICVYLISM